VSPAEGVTSVSRNFASAASAAPVVPVAVEPVVPVVPVAPLVAGGAGAVVELDGAAFRHPVTVIRRSELVD
jgi:hypothetical protein